MSIDATEVLGHLGTARNNFIYGLACLYLTTLPKCQVTLANAYAQLGLFNVDDENKLKLTDEQVKAVEELRCAPFFLKGHASTIDKKFFTKKKGIELVEFLEKENIKLLGVNIDLTQVSNTMLFDKEHRNMFFNEFATMILRGFMKESYEIVLQFCSQKEDKNNLLKKFQGMHWYNFSTAIRNTVTHNFKFEFKGKKARANLPYEWNHLVISEDMEGEYLELSFFTFGDAWKLHYEYIEFLNGL